MGQYSKGVFSLIEFNGFLHRNDPKCTNLYKVYPVTFTISLNLRQETYFVKYIYTTPNNSFWWLDSQHSQGQITSPVVSQYNNNLKCFKYKCCGSHEGCDFSGQIDRKPAIVHYQSSRVRGSMTHITNFLHQLQRQNVQMKSDKTTVFHMRTNIKALNR